MSLADIAAAVNGRLTGGADEKTPVTGPVEHDSRKIEPGALFVALVGERADGHDFAATACRDGAVAVLAAREVDAPAIVVDDVLAALGRLARAVIDRLPDLTVVGITGSSGKTSTKDVIAGLCARLGETVATEGNFNNELGHPYTVCKVTETTRYLVLEMGARGLGHIDYLTQVAPVDVGVVLNVGTAHLEGFGSTEAIARAKSELPAAVGADGIAVLNADDPKVAAMRDVTDARIVTFGHGGDADVAAERVILTHGRPSYRLTVDGEQADVTLRLVGEHQVSNTLAAAAVAVSLGMSVADCAAALSEDVPVSARRMDVFTRPTDGVTVVDDSYNANPASMRAALHAQAELGQARRKVAVLGYMAELGEAEDSAHEEIGRLAGRLGVELLIVVEEAAERIAVGARATGVTVIVTDDQEQACQLLGELLHPKDVVLVKGSRYRTWDVADYLRNSTLNEEDHA